MLAPKTISKKRQKLIDEINNSPIAAGDKIGVLAIHLNPYPPDPNRIVTCNVLKVEDGLIQVMDEQYKHRAATITPDQVATRNIYYVGADPFVTWHSNIRSINFTFDSILFNLNILGEKRAIDEKYAYKGVTYEDLNWNPYVFGKNGEKFYYQRPFVWTKKQNQLLIESIYQDIECGRILIRKRSFKELDYLVDKGETEVAFNDIVDGKQRLHAVQQFIFGAFPDLEGNYYGDLSFAAQGKLLNHQLFTYCELPEETSDAAVLRQFLKLNFAGVPQSPQHIAYVKSLQNKM